MPPPLGTSAQVKRCQLSNLALKLLSFPACNCDSVGGVSGGECEGKYDPDAGLVAGRCICKKNVEGQRCNRCKPGFWNLRKSNPDGCEGDEIIKEYHTILFVCFYLGPGIPQVFNVSG